MSDASPLDPTSVLKSLADSGRLLLARVLAVGTFNVTELTDILSSGQSTVSRNLRILVEAGLVEGRREGRLVYYAWRRGLPPSGAGIRSWVEEHGPLLSEEVRRRMHGVWEARRERTASFFASVDPDDPAAAWLGSPDCFAMILESVSEADRVLDVGTGSGRLLAELAVRAESVIGVDASPSMLSAARRRLEEAGCSAVDLRLGDLAHLPLQDGEVDTVVANMVLHHLPEPAQAFSEIWRVLRPGGTLLIGDFLPHDQEWMRDHLADQWLGLAPADVHHWLDAAGFDSVDIEPLPPKNPGAVGVFVARAVRQ